MTAKLIFLTAVSMLLPLSTARLQGAEHEEGSSGSMFFERFADALPIPPTIKIGRHQRNVVMRLTQFKTKIHRDLPEVPRWGYNDSSPGPIIEVNENQKIRVHWKNELPATCPLPTAGGMEMGAPGEKLPEVRAVTHLHGAVVAEPRPMNRARNDDGWPDAWTVGGQEQLAVYGNPQSARALWYHDHAIGVTGRNVAAGLAGMYIIRDKYERSLNLPSGKYEIPLIFQTVALNAGGTGLTYTPNLSNEFYGNLMLVNGKVAPFLSVEPRKYRFRVLNAHNARALQLKLVDQTDRKTPGPPLVQIGTDSGFLEKPVTLNDPKDPKTIPLKLAAGERADLVVDFSAFAGHNYILFNDSITEPEREIGIPLAMLFKVGATVTEPDKSALPAAMRPIPKLDPAKVATTRQITMSQVKMADGTPMMILNGKNWRNGPNGDYEITEKPILGTSEVWELVNATYEPHPFHIHLVQFQTIDRHPFDGDKYTADHAISFTGDAVPPDPNEQGWKDVIRTEPWSVTRIIMRFAPFTGFYVYHCHILEHEDMDMMRPFEVIKPHRGD